MAGYLFSSMLNLLDGKRERRKLWFPIKKCARDCHGLTRTSCISEKIPSASHRTHRSSRCFSLARRLQKIRSPRRDYYDANKLRESCDFAFALCRSCRNGGISQPFVGRLCEYGNEKSLKLTLTLCGSTYCTYCTYFRSACHQRRMENFS